MRIKSITINSYYRHKNTPNYAWAKVLEILSPHTGINTHGYYIVKCEWTVNKDSGFGFIKYFKASDLIIPKEKSQCRTA